MKKEEIKLSDWQRILFGDAPPEFLLEVFIRTLIIYIALIVIARLLGKRMGGQLTLTETAVMITLGAIVAPAMQLPDRGVIFGIILLLCALLFQRGINLWGFNSSKFEKLSQGHSSVLVKDGVLDLEEMKKVRISRQELFAMLRHKNILNLGNVKRAYLEGCGLLSIFTNEGRRGLSLLPDQDDEQLDGMSAAAGSQACCSCGYVAIETQEECHNCGSKRWTKAIE
ncbi:DUF421 domain-containing protein [Pedobacter sp. SYSU D00535]|uniref:DUF421 domain-containing protein n=1 Tax=Pedobacter sp. SYSU D00535 TaxID=2810308 RepID=UPI001A96E634|nr:YetF domain-containing protein [Pedobacter sp. SYSU D00535]